MKQRFWWQLWWVYGCWVAATLSLAAFMYHYLPFMKLRPLYEGVIGRLFGGLALYDASNYIQIAHGSYSANIALRAFFPGYPLLLRSADVISGVLTSYPNNLLLAATVVNIGAFGLALGLLSRLLLLDYKAQQVWKILVLLLAFPFAFFFLAPYSESVFMLLLVGCVYLARQGWWTRACLLAMLASFTRVPGLVLGLVILVELLQQKDWDIRKAFPAAFNVLLAPLGAVAYFGYLYFNGGLATYRQSYAVGWPDRHTTVNILRPIYQPFITLISAHTIHPNTVLGLSGVALLIMTAIWGWRRAIIRPSYLTLVVVSLIVPLFSGSVESFGRYAMVVFPIYIVMAQLIRRWYLYWPAVVMSYGLQLGLMMLFVRGTFVG